jgi:hypothetical protein
MHPPLRHWDIGPSRMPVAAHVVIEWAGSTLKLQANWKLMSTDVISLVTSTIVRMGAVHREHAVLPAEDRAP